MYGIRFRSMFFKDSREDLRCMGKGLVQTVCRGLGDFSLGVNEQSLRFPSFH